MQNLSSLLWLVSGFFGKRRRREQESGEPVYFSRLKHLSDGEWRAALAESPAKAARWVYAAATYGNIDAQLYWGQMLLDGYGTRRDPTGAFRWFTIAAESKRADAINMLGRCHERGWGVPSDCAKAAACYRHAAEQSFDWAQFNLASLMLDGKGVARDPDGACELFMQAAAQGHVKSLNMVGRCYEHGWGRPRDMIAAVEWYRRSAEGGDFRGQYRYGQMLFERGSVADALAWLRLAVDTAPVEFCRDIAGELLCHCAAPVRDIGRHARSIVAEADAKAAADPPSIA